ESRVHRRLEQPPRVLAVILGLVEGKVGFDDHAVDIGLADPVEDGAGAALDAQAMPGDVDLALESFEDRVELPPECRLVLDAIEEDHELVAAEAADPYILVGKGAEPLCDGIDQPVPNGMAECVVDALEVVEVEDGKAA